MVENTVSSKTASLVMTVQLEHGLHARPAARLARAAQGSKSVIRLVTEAGEAEASSLLDILSLGLSYGREVRIEAEGPDAEEAVQMTAQALTSDQE